MQQDKSKQSVRDDKGVFGTGKQLQKTCLFEFYKPGQTLYSESVESIVLLIWDRTDLPGLYVKIICNLYTTAI